MKISLIHPSRGRVQQAFETANKWLDLRSKENEIEYIFSVDADDPFANDYIQFDKGVTYVFTNKSMVEATNNGARYATGDLLIVVSDDFDCFQDWDKALVAEIGDNTDFLFMTKDDSEGQTICTLPIVDRIFYERFGYIYHPAYKHLFADTQLMSVAQMTGKLILSDLIFKHNHYTITGKLTDEVSAKANNTWQHGEDLYFVHSMTNFGIPINECVMDKNDLQPVQWIKEKRGLSKILLTIAIPTVTGREESFEKVKNAFDKQIKNLANPDCVEILCIKDDKTMTIGEKRNQLAKKAKGLFIYMNDDDDDPVYYFLETIIPILEKNPDLDCVEYLEHCYMDGKQYSSIFSNSFKEWGENIAGYDFVRTPFYKSPIKTSIVRRIGFKDIRYGEDHDFSIRLKESGLIQKSYFINRVMYVYAPKVEGTFEERYGFERTANKHVSLSCTEDEKYSYFIPLTIWAWNHWGFEVILFIPEGDYPKMQFAIEYAKGLDLKFTVFKFSSTLGRQATYSQCSRLYAGAIDLPESDYIITGDIDMLPCNNYFSKLDTSFITAIGEDLTDYREYPMCYIGMPVAQWRHVMGINQRTYQECLDDLMKDVPGENTRGDQWSLDQFTVTNKLKQSGQPIYSIERGRNGGGASLNRADRDGWEVPDYCIDAHMPRNIGGEDNFGKIIGLLLKQFPEENFDWVKTYDLVFPLYQNA